MPRIRKLIQLSMLSVRNKMNAGHRKFSFEVFGYDFIIDSDFGVYLIEVNTNPCLELSSPLLENYIPKMLDGALTLTIDRVFDKGLVHKSLAQPEHEKVPARKTRWRRIKM
jgi:hypothetical protein